MAGSRAKSKGKSNRGGRRPGAGRKSKAITRLRADWHEAVNDLIAPAMPRLVASLLTLAEGGDRAAAEYLINRLAGKPTERHEHDFDAASDEALIREASELLACLHPSGPGVAGNGHAAHVP